MDTHIDALFTEFVDALVDLVLDEIEYEEQILDVVTPLLGEMVEKVCREIEVEMAATACSELETEMTATVSSELQVEMVGTDGSEVEIEEVIWLAGGGDVPAIVSKVEDLPAEGQLEEREGQGELDRPNDLEAPAVEQHKPPRGRSRRIMAATWRGVRRATRLLLCGCFRGE